MRHDTVTTESSQIATIVGQNWNESLISMCDIVMIHW